MTTPNKPSMNFDEVFVKKTMHEFAMQTLGDVARTLFESCDNEIRSEMFKENLAANLIVTQLIS